MNIRNTETNNVKMVSDRAWNQKRTKVTNVPWWKPGFAVCVGYHAINKKNILKRKNLNNRDRNSETRNEDKSRSSNVER